MELIEKVSTGLQGLDQVIDWLRLGDNVVWQVDSPECYKAMVAPFIEQAARDKRKLIYVRFGKHEPLVGDDSETVRICRVEAGKGFESFATEVHDLIQREGKRAFYVFDCLTDLLEEWHSDLMIGNFFKVTCPFLYDLETVAYFSLIRNVHTFSTIAGIRETTQLLLDLYQVNNKTYVHPLKVWQRYSPTMFFPHLIQGQKAVGITSSTEAAELFSSIHRGAEMVDYWDATFNKARQMLSLPPEQQQSVKKLLMTMIIGHESRMFTLCDKYFTLEDILKIASREVGTGYIGGKSVGMLLARKILETEENGELAALLEPHDSYYLGSDIFYTYIVQNGWWELRTKQKTKEGYYAYAPELKEKMLHGKFPANIREKFIGMLEYFGQSPIIVRSSSLLEDNFGNAFAGKYESVFCVNQGTPEERYEAFEQAVRTVYASMMDTDALNYRMTRGLFDKDEQMAVLVQRVSGDYYDQYFFPHAAGVGNSSNLYVWDKNMDMNAGMLRLVFGLGTRAVDRTVGDYAKIVSLDNPLRAPLTDYRDLKKFSQNEVDVLSLSENRITSKKLEDILSLDIRVGKELFAHPDYDTASRLKELGYSNPQVPWILDFKKMLRDTGFPEYMRKILKLLSKTYDYPVDIEFTVNYQQDSFRVNLLQCRPLQTRGLGKAVRMPKLEDSGDCFFCSKGRFMGGNVRLPIDYVIYVQIKPYLQLTEQEKYSVARQIGALNTLLKGENVMLAGPGRWGTSTPSLGVPVNFSELCFISVLCEVASAAEGFLPELSYGSHFFQDIVESGIFYVAIFDGEEDVVFHPEKILHKENLLKTFLPDSHLSHVIHVAQSKGMEIYSDITSQTVICR